MQLLWPKWSTTVNCFMSFQHLGTESRMVKLHCHLAIEPKRSFILTLKLWLTVSLAITDRLMAQILSKFSPKVLVSHKARWSCDQFSFIPKNSCGIQLTSHFYRKGADPTIGGPNPRNFAGSETPAKFHQRCWRTTAYKSQRLILFWTQRDWWTWYSYFISCTNLDWQFVAQLYRLAQV